MNTTSPRLVASGDHEASAAAGGVEITVEVESKFEVPTGFALPDLPGSTWGERRRDDLDATYYDTAALDLAGLGIILRRRFGGDDEGWHLKLPLSRGEKVEVRVPCADGPLPAELADRLATLTGGAELGPVVRLCTERISRTAVAPDGVVLVDVALDHVRATALRDGAGRDELVWTELEVELVDGDRTAMAAIVAGVLGAGATRSRSASKLERALHGLYRVADHRECA